MTRYFRGEGKTLRINAPAGGVVSGMGYIIGAAFGVAQVSAAQGVSVDLQLGEAHQLPKTANEAWPNIGASVYWDDANKVATLTAGANMKIGIVFETAAAADARGCVRLNGSF
ncbi:DUF2190 family protein [Bradyrhizobium paxllaeri]|uniref:DUF2190 family protein n=1 Tax=Bradyrhizobium paxllaeri TaxID=190148 RepID=UPI000810D420|nr:DUF2190 family protein [Bradyrhizobium paxllaeri]